MTSNINITTCKKFKNIFQNKLESKYNCPYFFVKYWYFKIKDINLWIIRYTCGELLNHIVF